ncbi:putative disease resistance RPP13 protein 1 [Spatholobus suberectus]|nr:putative disease resistance RPP13 protein 1 [Spatholobus suberectus]
MWWLTISCRSPWGSSSDQITEKEWNRVLKSNIWDLPNVKVLPALLLSYHYLPAPLKRYFAYCSIFPKNSILDKSMMVQLWIAEGLVHQSKSSKSMEEVGDEYFDELVSRSLIRQQTKETFVMHDLIYELATTVSSAYCIRHEDPKPHENHERTGRLSYNRGRCDCFNRFDTLDGAKCLRTF